MRTRNAFKLKKLLSLLMVFVFVTGMVFGGLPQTAQAANSIPTYLDPTATVEDRVADLLGRMTIDEKVGQMIQAEKRYISIDDVMEYKLGSVLSGGGSFPGSGAEADSTMEKWSALYDQMQDAALSTRLGIPLLYGVDAVHGHSNVKGATVFPHNIGLGASRDTALVERIGDAVAKEVKATGVNWTFAPTVADPQNIKWGRTYEGFGENLNLVAQMGVAYTRGLQGANIVSDLKKTNKVVATAKHYIGEGWVQNGTNQGDVSNLTKEQIAAQLIKPYADAVAAGVRSVMVSFNSINGVKCHASKYLITDILKEQLNFDGIVITDYDGIEQIRIDEEGNSVSGLKAQLKVSINAGVDMLMETGNWKNCITYIKELVEDEKANEGSGIPESRIDDAVKRILRVKFQAGVFENTKTDSSLTSEFGSTGNREIAREAVRKSLVLLKNDDVNGTPILSQLKDMDNIFVTGKSADNLGNQCGGWTITWQGKSGNDLTTGTTILKGIQDALKDTGKTVTYNKHGRVPAGSDVAIVVVGETPYAESNGDSNIVSLDSEDIATLQNVKNSGVPTIVIMVSGRPMIINDYLNDWDGLIEAWLPGTEGQGVADVLFGNYDFTGKLPIKWPFYLEVLPIVDSNSPYILFNYGYGLTKGEVTPTLPAVPEKPKGSLPTGVTPVEVPASRVEAENPYAVSGWDLNNPGNSFIETGSGRSGDKSVGWTSAGKWLKYFVNAAQSGWYKVDFGVASPDGAAGAIQLRDGDGNVLCTASAPRTGGWSVWGTSTAYVQLPYSGEQVIEFYCVSSGFNFDYMQFTKVDGPPADNGDGDETPVIPSNPAIDGGADAVQVWMSTERKPTSRDWYYDSQYTGEEKKLQRQENLDITAVDDSDLTTIKIDPAQKYQEIMGIGTSFEGSSIHNLMKMSPEKRREVISAMVDPEVGIGMSMIRLTIGTPDFIAGDWYSYDDMPAGETDEDLSEFSIENDKRPDQNIIQAVKEAQAIADSKGVTLKFFASPWSPPGWMKTTDSMVRGQVKDEYLPILAKYYLKYLQAYKAEGIDIEAMTLQNEPLLEIDYPSCKMPWQQEAELAKLLRAEIDNYNSTVPAEQRLDVKLWIFDHNPGDTMTYPAQIFRDEANRAAIDGTAFHDYGGDLGEMTKLHNMYPDENIYLTERAVWGTTGADRIAQYFRNWAKSYNSWVFMLDSDIATHRWVGTPDPTPFIQDAGNPDNYWILPEVYLTGQFSKFIKPGFIRINSNYGSSDKVTNVAFLDPGTGNIVTVVINQTSKTQGFKIVCEGNQIATTIPAKTAATYVWHPVAVDGNNGGSGSGGEIDYTPSTVISLRAGADSVTESVYQWDIIDGQLKNGHSGISHADYSINIPESGDYAVDIRYAGTGSRTFQLDYGSGSSINLVGAGTVSWEDWFNKSVRGIIHLDAGLQTIRLTLAHQAEWTDVKSITFTKMQDLTAPVKIDATQAISYSDLAVAGSSSSNNFGNTGAGSWMAYNVNISESKMYTIKYNVATGNSNAKIKLKVNDEFKAPIDVTRTDWSSWITVSDNVTLPAGSVTMAVYCDTNGYNFNWLSIGPVQSEIEAALGYSLDGQIVSISITNGIFVKEHVGDITLAGATPLSITYIDPTHVRVLLGWENMVEDGDTLTVNVPTSAYAGNSESLLSASITVANTINNADAVDIPGKIEAENYYLKDGVTTETAESNTYVVFGENGGWVDYFINVPETNDYTINMKINPKNALTGALQLMDGTEVLAAFNTPSVDNKWVDLRRTVPLTAGQHHLKLFASMGSFNVNWLQFTPKAAQDISGEAIIQAESYINSDQIPVEGENNLGYVVAGNYVDYYISVPETTDYTVTYTYTTAQSGCSISLMDVVGSSATELSRTNLPSTGGWGNYATAKGAVRLTSGVHTIRLVDNGDGFNLDSFKFTEGVSEGNVVLSKVATPTASLKSGTYTGARSVVLSSSTEGAVIYYTLDGSLPTTESTVYNREIIVNGVSIIRAIAVKSGMANSYVAKYYYINNTGTTGSGTVGSGGVGGIGNNEQNSSVIEVKTKVENGVAESKVTLNEIDKAFEQAKSDAEGNKIITIEVKAAEGAKEYALELPVETLSSDSVDKKIEISTSIAKMTVSENMLNTLDIKDKTVKLSIGTADVSALSEAAKQQIGNRPVLELNVKVDGKAIEWNNPNAPVTVAIDYTPTAEELKDPEHIVVYYIDGKGNLIAVPTGKYDKTTGKVIFTTTHFSKYAVAFVKKTYVDIAKYSWIVKPVEVLASKGIIEGTSDKNFSPNQAVTRGEFIAWLVKTLGLTTDFDTNFNDVSKTHKYYEEMGIAKKLGIAQGNNNNFSPDKQISRQDMMALTIRALKVANKKLSVGTKNDIMKYTDVSKVAKYAVEDVATMVKEGLIKGSGKKLNPTADMSRAEVAIVLYRIYTEK